MDNQKDSASASKPKMVPANDGSVAKQKRRGFLFRSFASAQDLRQFDLEKEKEDATSPRGVLEAYMRGFDSLQTPEPTTHRKSQNKWSKYFKIWKKKSFSRLSSFPPLSVPKIPKGKSKSSRDNPALSNMYNLRSSLVNFKISELRNATNNFSNGNMIGRGGFSEVYKGQLKDGSLIAVKKLTRGTQEERTASFLSELGIIAHVHHPNTAKLIGCDVEGGMLLVFQLSPLGSLGSLLHGSKDNKLDWSRRYKIALGIADGLLYLHESCHRRIIHRDIKSENILLTESFEPQICDFGSAKWLPKQWTHHNVSKFEGTFGYFAPEYFMHGIVDEKIDVYSFGVILLELISGRPAVDQNQQSVVVWAKPLLDDNNVRELVDPCLGDEYERQEMDRVLLTASLSIEHSPLLRPNMSQAAILLRGDEYAEQSTKESKRLTFQRTYSEEILDAQEYNSTKCLRDRPRILRANHV